MNLLNSKSECKYKKFYDRMAEMQLKGCSISAKFLQTFMRGIFRTYRLIGTKKLCDHSQSFFKYYKS